MDQRSLPGFGKSRDEGIRERKLVQGLELPGSEQRGLIYLLNEFQIQALHLGLFLSAASSFARQISKQHQERIFKQSQPHKGYPGEKVLHPPARQRNCLR